LSLLKQQVAKVTPVA